MIDYVLTVINRIGFKSANLIFFIFVGKSLSIEDMGLFGIYISLSLLISTILDFGIRNTATYKIGKEELAASTFVYYINKYILYLGVGAGLLLLAFIIIAPTSFDKAILTLLFLSILTLSYTRMTQAAFLGKDQVADYNKSESYARFTLLICMLIMYTTGLSSLFEVCLATALSNLTSALFCFFRTKALSNKVQLNGHSFVGTFLPIFKVGSYFMFAVLLMTLSKRAHVLYLAESSTSLSGVFFGLFRVSEIFIELALAVSIVLMSKTSAEKDIRALVSKSAKATRICFFLATTLLPLILMFPQYLISLFLNLDYLAYIKEFQIICIASFIGITWTVLFPVAGHILSSKSLFILMIVCFSPIFALYEILLFENGELTLINSSYLFLMGNILITAAIVLRLGKRAQIPYISFFIPTPSDFRIQRR